MEINQLVYLVAIVEEASFSRAADRLGVAQPSISQQIKKLEEEVGTPLLDRLPRRVVPTAAGERLLEHARTVGEGETFMLDKLLIKVLETPGHTDISRTRASPTSTGNNGSQRIQRGIRHCGNAGNCQRVLIPSNI